MHPNMVVIGNLSEWLRINFLPASYGRWNIWIPTLDTTNGLLRDLPNDTAGIARGKHALWNVPGNDTPSADHRT